MRSRRKDTVSITSLEGVTKSDSPIKVDMEQCGIVGVRYTNTLLPATWMSSGVTTRSCSSETGCSGSVIDRSKSAQSASDSAFSGLATAMLPRRISVVETRRLTKDLLGVNLFPLLFARPSFIRQGVTLGIGVPQKRLRRLLPFRRRGGRGKDGRVGVV